MPARNVSTTRRADPKVPSEDEAPRLAQEVASTVADPWNVEENLNKYMEKTSADSYRRDVEDPYPGACNITPGVVSGMQGSKCSKYIGYKATGEPRRKKRSLVLEVMGVIGTAVHEWMQKALIEMLGDEVEVEVDAINGELWIKGKGDGEYKSRYGLEIKTINTRGYNEVCRTLRPTDAHADQIAFYFDARKWESCTFVYINREKIKWGKRLPMKIIVVGPDYPRFKKLRRRLLTEGMAQLGKGKAPLESRGRWCETCEYKTPCDAGEFGG
jgi:hypothetical protein